MVLVKTLENPLDNKEIKPVNPKWNQPWIFIGRIVTETEAPVLSPLDAKSQPIGKGPGARKDWRQNEKRLAEDVMVRYHHQLIGHEWQQTYLGFSDDSAGEESACNVGDTGDVSSTPGSGRSPGGGNGNPLQYSCLKNPMNRGASQAMVQRVAKRWTQLSTHTHTHREVVEDREAGHVTVNGVAKSWLGLSNWTVSTTNYNGEDLCFGLCRVTTLPYSWT